MLMGAHFRYSLLLMVHGSKFHANRVLAARGLTNCFHQIFGIEDADYIPKPEKDAYQKIKSSYLRTWIKQTFGDSKKITAWGCGKVAKKQATYLFENGINITSFYEVDCKKIGHDFLNAPILPIDAISGDRDELILVLSGARSAYQKIYNFLSAKKLHNGRDFLFMA